jgi:pSer/pThr/pTyr-binding forkhead associated (FHA) protein
VSAAPRPVATQVVPPPAPKATEVFFDLGAELAVTDGPDRGKHFNLTKPAITIGRSGARQNDVTLSDASVSREHAKIIYSAAEKTFRLINESATNPVRLNGNAVDTALIKDGDTLQLGSTIFKFNKRA